MSIRADRTLDGSNVRAKHQYSIHISKELIYAHCVCFYNFETKIEM